MVLITGGRYQGKMEYAQRRFRFQEADLAICREDVPAIDFDKPCIAYIERYVLACLKQAMDPLAAFEPHLSDLRDKVILSTDISCGVVPVEAQLRAWRDACGRLNNALASASDEVWRLFCGIPQRLK